MITKNRNSQFLWLRTFWYVALCLLFAAIISLSTFFTPSQRSAYAATSSTMNFQARLLQGSGALVADGYYNVQFKLYNVSTGGTEEWAETYSQSNRVRVMNGYLTVNLGAITVFPNTINWDQEHWLTMNIGGTTNTPTPAWDGEMTPRLKLTAVPYAFTAGKLQQTSGVQTSTLGFANQTASRNILLPDESGTVCLQGSTNCGFVTGSAANFIQNGTTPQTANFNVTGNGTLGGALGVGGNLTFTGSSAAIINRSASANSNAILVTRMSTDSQDKFRIEANGRMYWGNGTDALDTTLYRVGVNTLQTDGAFTSGGTIYAGGAGLSLTGASGSVLKTYSTSGTVNQNDVVVLVNSSGAKVATSTTPRDTRIVGVYRGGSGNASGSVAIGGDTPVNVTAGVVNVGDQLVVSSEAGRATVDNNATSGILGYAVSYKAAGSVGSVTARIAVVNGNTNPYYQVNDYRIQNAAGTTDLMRIDGTANRIAIGPSAVPGNGVLTIGTDTTAASGGLYFGTDTNLYRLAANTLKTDGTLEVSSARLHNTSGNFNARGADSAGRARFITSVSGDTNTLGRFYIAANGALNWGNGTDAPDTTLSRSGVGQLNTGGIFSAGGYISAQSYVSSAGLYTAHNNSGSTVEFRSGMRDTAGNTGNAIFRSGYNTSTGNTGIVYLQSGNAAAGNSGNIIIDAGTASGTTGSVSIGATSASSVLLGRSGTTVSIQGAATISNNLTLSSGQFTNSASTVNTAAALGDFPTGGVVGTAAATVDVKTTLTIAQTTPGQNLSLPSPTSTTAGRIMYVLNTGTTPFDMHGVNITNGYGQIYMWSGSAWVLGASGGGSAITLQSAYDGGNSLNTSNARDISFTLADTATDGNFLVNIASGSTGQFKIQSNGTDLMAMGATGQLALNIQGPNGGLLIGEDATLYRSAAQLLKTTGSFAADGNVYSGHGTANQIRLNNNGQIQFGSTGDTNLYRSAADTLRTDDALIVAGQLTAAGLLNSTGAMISQRAADTDRAIDVQVIGDSGPRLRVSAGGRLSFGPGNGTLDTNLYRSGTGYLRTDNNLQIGGSNLNILNANAAITFGAGSDVNLYRSGANMLATDDSFSLLGAASNLTVQGTGTSTFDGTIAVKDFNRVQANALANTYYASLPQALTQSPMGRSWHDLFAFNRSNGTPTFEQSPDGSTWNAATLNSQVFAQTENVPVGILDGVTNTSARYTWNSSNLAFATNSWGWLVAKIPYTSATAATKTILVESSPDGITWTSRANVSGISSQQQAVYMPVSSWGSHTRLRITITSTNGQNIYLSGLQMLTDRVGSQGSGVEYELPYAWDTNMNLITQGSGGTTGVLRIGATNTTTADRGVYFGNDTNLYRSGANALATDDSFSLLGPGSNLTVQGTGTSSFAGNLTVSGTITGNGSGLTNLSGTQVTTGTIADARLSTNVALKNVNNNFTTSQTVSGTVTATSFAGEGSGLTDLNASNVSSGILNDARLSSNVTLLNRNNQTFTGSDQLFKNSTNSTTALSVQNAVGDTLFNADTANQRINIGTATSSAKLTVSGEMTNTSTWTTRTAAEANSWASVTYGNGQFVAVAGSGTNRVMTSPDGITWTARTAPEANNWVSVTYGNGLFVAVSSNGTNRVMTSPDGITWTARTAPQYSWNRISYGNGLFVVTNQSSDFMTSSDGVNWTSRTFPENNFWNSVSYGNGTFVAVSSNGTNRVMTSSDGITWTTRTAAEANSWASVTYGNGQFVAVAGSGTNRVMTSPDGITWTARTAEAYQWNSITYGNGLFVATASSTNRVMTSSDGITWTSSLTPDLITGGAITYGNGLFTVVYNSNSRIMTSSGGYQKAMNVLGDIDVNGTIRQNGYEVCTTAGNCKGSGANPNVMLLDADQTVTSIKTFSNTVNISGSNVITLGSDVSLSRTSANVLGLSTGDSLNIINGNLQVGGTSVINASRVLQNVTADTSIVTSGTFDDARLSSNVALINRNSQTFTGNNQVFRNTTNSTSAFSIQNSTSGNILNVDTTNTRVTIGTVSAPTLSGANLVVANAEVQTTIRIGSGSNGVDISGSTGITYNGTARKTKKMIITPEYAGAVLDGTGVGSMTAGHDGTRRENYYKWTAASGTMQEYDIVLTMPVPSDWSGWASSNALSVNTYSSGAVNAGSSVTVIGTTGVTDVNLGAATPSSGWSTYNFNLNDIRYAADGTMTIKLRVGAQSSGVAQVGNITLTYLSKF